MKNIREDVKLQNLWRSEWKIFQELLSCILLFLYIQTSNKIYPATLHYPCVSNTLSCPNALAATMQNYTNKCFRDACELQTDTGTHTTPQRRWNYKKMEHERRTNLNDIGTSSSPPKHNYMYTPLWAQRWVTRRNAHLFTLRRSDNWNSLWLKYIVTAAALPRDQLQNFTALRNISMYSATSTMTLNYKLIARDVCPKWL